MVRARGLAVLIAATFVAFACGGTTTTGGSKGTIKIGSDLPTCTAGGLTTQNGVQWAVQKKGTIEGFTVQFQGFDDCRQGKYNQDAGVENVQKMLGDNKFLGMVGPYNSAVAEAEIPITSAQHFTMVSPSNTRECLTVDFSYCKVHPADLRKGNPNNYWRVVTRDDYQGPAMSIYAYKTLKLTKVGILDDSTVFGAGIADNFEKKFKDLGGTTTRDSYKVDQTSDFRSKLLKFKNFGAQGVYLAGTSDQNLCVPKAQMKAIGWDVPVLGADGIEEPECIDQAADNTSGIYVTSAGADATKVPSAASAIADFKKAFPGPNDFGGYTMQSADAASALMEAIGRAIKGNGGNMPSREQVRAEMAKTKGFVGVIGTYDFDSAGDTSLKIVSVYVAKSGDPATSSGVCGTKPANKNICFFWTAQFDFAKPV